MANGKLPLSRFMVLDLSRVRGGPVAVRQLADWGADVIKIEMPVTEEDDTGSRHRADFQNLHRNKRSLTLNLKSADGIEILHKLVRKADVVVENYRPNVKHRLGIDYESLRKLNSRLVYGSLSGFGQDGPYADRPGVDQIAQGMGGVMSVTGLPGQGPVRCGAAIADVASGLYLAFGIVMALLEREQSGEGQWVHTSLLEAQIGLMDFQAAAWLFDKEVPGQAGNNHPKSLPTGTFEAKDGHINIGAGSQERWIRLCKAIGGEALIARPEFRSAVERRKNRAALNDALTEFTRQRTMAEWVEVLNAAGVPCGPVYSVDQTFADPQVRHLGIAAKVAHPVLGERELVGQPVHLSRAQFSVRSATPEAGAHNEEILTALGYDRAAVAALRERKVI
jgi:formyl-CoA transferase